MDGGYLQGGEQPASKGGRVTPPTPPLNETLGIIILSPVNGLHVRSIYRLSTRDVFLCSAIEHFVKKKEDIVNIKKDDGYMPLHLAALNDHLDVVTALTEMVKLMPILYRNNNLCQVFTIKFCLFCCGSPFWLCFKMTDLNILLLF